MKFIIAVCAIVYVLSNTYQGTIYSWLDNSVKHQEFVFGAGVCLDRMNNHPLKHAWDPALCTPLL